MNKYAAEKIASQYYNAGLELAFHQAGLIKTAKMTDAAKKALAGLLGVGAGAGGLAAYMRSLGKGGTTGAGKGIALGQPSAASGLENILAQAEAQSAKFSPDDLLVSTGAGPGIALGQAAAPKAVYSDPAMVIKNLVGDVGATGAGPGIRLDQIHGAAKAPSQYVDAVKSIVGDLGATGAGPGISLNQIHGAPALKDVIGGVGDVAAKYLP